MKFKLHYYISNQGDGSAAIRLCKSAEEAEQLDEAAQEEEGWGEPSNSYIDLKIEDGKLFYSEYEKVNGKYQYVWHPLEEVK